VKEQAFMAGFMCQKEGLMIFLAVFCKGYVTGGEADLTPCIAKLQNSERD
jgi:hypothetical protein